MQPQNTTPQTPTQPQQPVAMIYRPVPITYVPSLARVLVVRVVGVQS